MATDWMLNQAMECDPAGNPYAPLRKPAPAERRFFLAHAKSEDDLDEKLKAAQAMMTKGANGKPFSIRLGRDFYESDFKRCGSWDAWANEVAQGVDHLTREPLFHGILVPAGRVGRATFQIVTKALEIGKPVFAFRLDGTSARVVRVTWENGHDWQTGGKITVAARFA